MSVRFIYVIFDGVSLKTCPINLNGITKGSTLLPTLFLFHRKDLSVTFKPVYTYVDDNTNICIGGQR